MTERLSLHYTSIRGFPGGSVLKNLPANARDAGLITGSGKSPGEGNGKPLQYACLENLMDRGALHATVHGVTKVSDLETKQQQIHLYAAAAAAKPPQSCPTLCDPIDGSPPRSPIPGILQARTLEWGAIAFSNT